MRDSRTEDPDPRHGFLNHVEAARRYLADSGHAAVHPLVPLPGLHRPLLEEEVDFIIVRAARVRDGEGAHKIWLWEGDGTHLTLWASLCFYRLFVNYRYNKWRSNRDGGGAITSLNCQKMSAFRFFSFLFLSATAFCFMSYVPYPSLLLSISKIHY